MPLREDLLNPIPGDNPSGVSLRYDPIYDKVKEARREEVQAGALDRDRKVADPKLVMKLAGEALASKSKDLQLAVWVVEAHLKLEGYRGFREGLDYLKALMENFWDTMYPEIEDGDMELRAAPLEWLAVYLDREPFPLRTAPMTRSGLNYVKYKESRTVPAETETSETKIQQRTEMIAEGKLAPEEFDKAFNATPKAFYVDLLENIDGCVESLQALGSACQEKFGDYAPSFGPLEKCLEEVQVVARGLLNRKRETEPDADTTGAGESAPAPDDDYGQSYTPSPTAAAPAARPAARRVVGLEPADLDDAFARVMAVAKWLRQQDAYSPAAFMMVRGLRWGELLAGGESPDPTLLVAPPGELRQDLKKLSLESNWADVLEKGEEAAALPCGRGWLDLHRYTVRACEALGYYDNTIRAIKAGLRMLLSQLPALIDWTLMDDTPTANPETRTWLQSEVLEDGGSSAAPMVAYTPPPVPVHQAASSEGGAPAGPDVFQMAMDAARAGRKKDAVEILARQAAVETTGRGRFQRKVEVAQVCLQTGYEDMAHSILEELAAEIDRRKLEEWEKPEMVSQPLALLYRTMSRRDGGAEMRQKLYATLCRLDPLQALSVSK